MGKKEKQEKKGSENGGSGRGFSSKGVVGAPIGDPRFSRLHTDPRFQRLPKNKAKVPIDSRFARMFTEKGFSNPSRNKRGKESSKTSQIDPLRRYYKVDEDEEDEDAGGEGDAQINEVIIKKKKRGKKDRAQKEEQFTTAREEIDEIGDSEEELGPVSSSRVDVSVAGKKKGKKDRSKKPHAGAKVQISEAGLHSEDTDELEEVVEEEDDQLQRARVAPGFKVTIDSDEEVEDDDDNESELDEGLEEGGSSSSSSSSSDSEGDLEQEFSEAEEEEKIPTTNDETRRLALVNMDWEHIRAVHLLVLIRSFAPKGGSVHSVTVYPSEFGVEQMREESVHGPKGIFKQNVEEDVTDDEGADPEKLREYEKAKLRYYYAVVDCDSPSTAAHIYKNCDGLEFERTSNTLDLRYIPDEMEFKRDPRDVATEVPLDYKAIEFETRALQHSNVKLTWDDDEPVRVKALRRNFNREELNEMDFRAYVASSSESEFEAEDEAGEDVYGADGDASIEPNVVEDKKEKFRLKYLSLLAGGTDEADLVHGKKAEKGNIEIKFHTGLDELSEKLLSKTKKDKADETVWEAYLRRKKEKKNARKNKRSGTDSDVSSADEEMHSDRLPNHESDPFFSHADDDPFNDPFFNQGSDLPGKANNNRKDKEGKIKDLNGSKKEEERKKKKDEAAKDKKEQEKKQAELELLLLDDHMVQNGEVVPETEALEDYGKVHKLDKKKKKKKKGSKGKSEELHKKIASTADYNDPRFTSLFSSHLFAVDPTDPQFKKSGSHLAEMQRQHFQSSKNSQSELDKSGNSDGEQGRKRKRKGEVSSLVRSLKSKVQAKALRNSLR